jgi:predicted AlkP superfamily pyrophosphatase or phosphodiesterase
MAQISGTSDTEIVQTEKAVVFVFDGMRYDIWDEFLKPMLESHMKLLHNFPAISILPSETHVS